MHAEPTDAAARNEEPAPRIPALLAANVIYVFCLTVPEIAIPLILVPQFHASPV
ncbi:hypothetical protein [Actinomadura litoris]|uniref:hypothetical protein n=1 Tax=Actinomadura litoris TaxID=2678616 RepID=UPI001FA7F091|nr:hypothetical protein [Actinomadura litoris]